MVRDPLSLRPEAPEPLYQQVKQFVIDGIRSGEWGDTKRLPSENFLVSQLNVSRMTVHRALRELKSEGVIIRVPAAGRSSPRRSLAPRCSRPRTLPRKSRAGAPPIAAAS